MIQSDAKTRTTLCQDAYVCLDMVDVLMDLLIVCRRTFFLALESLVVLAPSARC